MRDFRILRMFFLVLTVAAIFPGLACSKKEAEQEPVVAVQVAPAQRGEIRQQINVEAVLFPKDQAALTAKISAPVKKFYVIRGSRVHKGELLAVLENRDLAAAEVENKGAFEQAQAAYNLETSSALPEEWQKAEYDLKAAKEAYDAEQKVYESRQNLYKEGALPRKELDQSAVAVVQAKGQYEVAQKHMAALEAAGKKDQLKSAKGQLTSAQGKYQGAAAQLSYSEIRSPIDGVVTERPLYPGEMAPAGSPILTVMDTSKVIAKAHIPQEDAAALTRGDSATIAAGGDSNVIGKVTVISPALDPNSTTVEIWVEAANPKGVLRPGSTVHLQIAGRSEKNAVIVPAAALMKTPEGANMVMVAGSDGRAHQVSVETGVQEDDRVQIVKGLSGNEKVIVRGAYGIPDKTKITVTAASPEGGSKPDAGEPTGEKDKSGEKDKD
ncbi:MAG: efflux RND transporter periplasmic adaptor subunit [Terriglobales bacterium]